MNDNYLGLLTTFGGSVLLTLIIIRRYHHMHMPFVDPQGQYQPK